MGGLVLAVAGVQTRARVNAYSAKTGGGMGRLDDEVALVTGASSGIGAGLARMLARQGAAVALVARREAALRKVADEIEADGGTALVAPADIGRDEDLDALVRRVRAELGPVDVLVNAAGVGVYQHV